MTIERITISLQKSTATKLRKAAGRGAVSAWVTKLIEEKLEEKELERVWSEFYREVNPGPEDVRKAEEIMERIRSPRRRRRKAA